MRFLRVYKKLSNQKFMAKAPEAVVNEEREKGKNMRSYAAGCYKQNREFKLRIEGLN